MKQNLDKMFQHAKSLLVDSDRDAPEALAWTAAEKAAIKMLESHDLLPKVVNPTSDKTVEVSYYENNKHVTLAFPDARSAYYWQSSPTIKGKLIDVEDRNLSTTLQRAGEFLKE